MTTFVCLIYQAFQTTQFRVGCPIYYLCKKCGKLLYVIDISYNYLRKIKILVMGYLTYCLC